MSYASSSSFGEALCRYQAARVRWLFETCVTCPVLSGVCPHCCPEPCAYHLCYSSRIIVLGLLPPVAPKGPVGHVVDLKGFHWWMHATKLSFCLQNASLTEHRGCCWGRPVGAKAYRLKAEPTNVGVRTVVGCVNNAQPPHAADPGGVMDYTPCHGSPHAAPSPPTPPVCIRPAVTDGMNSR